MNEYLQSSDLKDFDRAIFVYRRMHTTTMAVLRHTTNVAMTEEDCIGVSVRLMAPVPLTFGPKEGAGGKIVDDIVDMIAVLRRRAAKSISTG